MLSGIPHTKVERLAWYASHFPRMKHESLLNIATNPQRGILDINERIVAIMFILKDGIKSDDEIEPLFSLVKDEEDYPIYSGDTNKKQNNALLRGDAAIALAKYGFKDKEFTDTLIEILNFTALDPVFIEKDKATTYFLNFLTALYLTDKYSARRFMRVYSITDKELIAQSNSIR